MAETVSLTTLFCAECGKERPFRFSGIRDGQFVHQCAVCEAEFATAVVEGSLRPSAPSPVNGSLFDRLHRKIMRDFCSYEVVDTGDPRFFKIHYRDVDGVDDFTVEYYDYKAVEIIHRFKRMTPGHRYYPWVNGNGRFRGGY